MIETTAAPIARPLPAPTPRVTTLDIVKGLAIVLVVYGHALQGMEHRGLVNSRFYEFSDTLVYSFHMPAFFFVSGLFARLDSAASAGSLLRRRAGQILWPYVLWAAIMEALSPVFAAYTFNGPHQFNLPEFLLSVTLGTGSWFLWALFAAHTLGVLTRRVDRRALLGASLLGYWIVSSGVWHAPQNVTAVLHNLPYFIVGARWSAEFLGLLAKPIPARELAAAGLAAFLAGATAWECSAYAPPLALRPLLDLAMAIAGTGLLAAVAEIFGDTLPGRTLRQIGLASLAIFLLHPYPQGGTRAVWARLFGEHAAATSLIAQTVLAVALPTLFFFLVERWGGGWLFRFPQRIGKT